MIDQSLDNGEIVADILNQCQAKSWYIAAAESLTGGLLADALVSVPGASRVFLGSAVTYDIHAKAKILHVDRCLLQQQGAVCADVAYQMAYQTRALYAGSGWQYPSDSHDSQAIPIIGLSTTGVAGPGPDGGKPAGLVYVGLSIPQVILQDLGMQSIEHAARGLCQNEQSIQSLTTFVGQESRTFVYQLQIKACGRQKVRGAVVSSVIHILHHLLQLDTDARKA